MAFFGSRRAVTGLVALTCVLAASQTAWAQGRPGEHGAPAPRGGAPAAPAPMGGGGGPRGGFGGGGFGGGAPVAQPAPAAPSPVAPSMPAVGRGWSGGDRGDWNRGDRGGWNRGSAPATAPAPQPNWGATQPGRHGTDGYRQPDYRPPESRQPVMGGSPAPRNDGWRGDGRRDNGWAGGRNDSWRGNSWNHNWRGDNRYDWRSLRNDNRMAFHVGRYYPPYRGYTYRRMSVGLVLDRLFYGPTYYITDYYNYRLPAPYGPYQWVRYWDDAVLVDIYTGEVVDVLYDFFW